MPRELLRGKLFQGVQALGEFAILREGWLFLEDEDTLSKRHSVLQESERRTPKCAFARVFSPPSLSLECKTPLFSRTLTFSKPLWNSHEPSSRRDATVSRTKGEWSFDLAVRRSLFSKRTSSRRLHSFHENQIKVARHDGLPPRLRAARPRGIIPKENSVDDL